MKIAIVEDEKLAAAYLKTLLEQQPIVSISEIICLSSVKDAISYFQQAQPDLIFMDIHLGDGKSLEIFQTIEIQTPVIFVTAYDSYAIQVFKQFTIDYILKPFEEKELHDALLKYKSIIENYKLPNTLNSFVQIESETKAKHRFLVHNGHKLKSIEANDIAYFIAEGKHLFLHTFSNNSFIYDSTIKKLITQLDETTFFRVNRKYIANIKAIEEIIKHNSQKVEIILATANNKKITITVSKSQITPLKRWLE